VYDKIIAAYSEKHRAYHTIDHIDACLRHLDAIVDEILGASTKIYQQFEANVRKEYKRVPSFIFRKKRKEILQNFFERPSIYSTSYFHDRLERQAKHNLAMAIEAL